MSAIWIIQKFRTLLTMQRPYIPASTVGKSFRIMKEWRGIHFDPRVLDAFFQVQAEFCI